MSYRSLGFAITFLISLTATTGVYSQDVRFRLETTDLDGNAIDTVNVGESFLLSAFTQHLDGYTTVDISGVFASYIDITFDSALAEFNGDVIFGDAYQNGRLSSLSAGFADNVGGFAFMKPTGIEETHLFSLPMQASSLGDIEFQSTESFFYPLHEILVYSSGDAVEPNLIEFGAAQLRVVPEPLDFRSAQFRVVPESNGTGILAVGLFMLAPIRRRRLSNWRSGNIKPTLRQE